MEVGTAIWIIEPSNLCLSTEVAEAQQDARSNSDQTSAARVSSLGS